MALESQAIERLKEYSYRVEIDGLMCAAVSEFEAGEVKIGESNHGGAGLNHVTKEAGMISFENAKLKGVIPLEGSGRQFWYDWVTKVQNPKTGTGSRPKQYKKNFSVYDLAPDGKPIRVWEFYGAFPVGYTLPNRKNNEESGDAFEEVTIAYDYRELRVLS